MKFSMDDFKKKLNKETVGRWIETYKRQIAVGGILLCLVVILSVTLLGNGDKKAGAEAKEGAAALQTSAADASDAAAESLEGAEGAEEAVEEPNDLMQDAYPQINTLMETYYNCMAAGDVDGVKAVVDVLTEEEQGYIEALTTLIEGYQNIRCYTKRGLEEDTYLVFVRYDLKFVAADTVAPGVQAYYVRPDGNGAYYIFLDTPDEALQEYVNEIIQDADVQALYEEVWTEFEAAKDADEKLAEYGMKLEQLKTGETGEGSEEAAEEGGEGTEGADSEQSEGTTEEGGEDTGDTEEESVSENTAQNASGEGTEVNKETRFTESTNVRAERSAESERLALGYQGEHVTQVMDYPDGWSKIIFNGQEGYCKTECLE